MKLYQVILEDHENLPPEYVATILLSVFHKDPKEVDEQIEDLKVSGFVVMDVLPFQFAEQKVAELQYLAQFDRIHLQCYYEELEA